MKLFVVLLCFSLLIAGCAKTRPETRPANVKVSAKSLGGNKPVQNDAPVITPDDTSFGEIVLVNKNARFVVIAFSSGNVLPPGRRVYAYRNGLKMAELKITGPQQDNNTVADIVTGMPQSNDEVRDN